MQLIGMLDSPYVRRVAVSLAVMDLPFTHRAVSVFRHFETFAALNPVVKAPTLITTDGVTLMDSTLILDVAERLAGPERSLCPADLARFTRMQRLVGLAMAANEKSVQLVYERTLRPEDKQHGPWLERVAGQLATAYGLLEAEVAALRPEGGGWLFGDRPTQADITAVTAWTFTGFVLPGQIDPAACPALAALAAWAESLPPFRAWPVDG